MSAHATPEQNSGQTVVKTWRPERQPHSRLAPVVVGWGSLIAQGTVLALLACGCSLSKDSVGRANDSSYESQAVDNPCVSSFDVGGDDNPLPTSDPPRTIRSDDPSELEYKDLSLDEAIQFAMSHSRVMRDLGGTILTAPDRMQTKYSSAMVTADPNFGIEGALSKFDPVLTASGDFEKNHRLFNNSFFAGGTNDLRQDLNVYTTQLAKTTAAGSQFFLRNNTDYNANNATANLFGSAWNTNIEAQVRQPLLQGAGTDFNRIAGPNGSMGNINGVLVARVNSKIGQIDFEIGLRDFVSNVVNSYWDLYFAYRDLDAKVTARDAALESWRRVEALKSAGRRGGEAQQESQAREQHYRLQEEVQNALTGRQVEGTRTNSGSSGGTFRGSGGVYTCERRLRLMMGMPITDGALIRPADDPNMSKAIFEWDVALAEALTRRPELRKQKWVIKNREMQLLASRNFLLPQLDASGLYRMRGFGKDLFDTPDNRYPGIFSSSWANLASAKFQEWQLGVEFSMPLGFRKGHAAVRNAELQLARERAILNEQERQVVHDLSNAISEMSRSHSVLETSYNRRVAAKRTLAAIREIPDPPPGTLFQELDAQRKLAESEAQYYRALVEYELAIKNVHFEKGSILEYNGIYLSELPSPSKAYKDAYEKIKMRTRAARWSQNAANGQIVSDGLVQQKYSSEDNSALQGKPSAVPAAPPASTDPREDEMPEAPLPKSTIPDPPVPLPQARREVLPTSLRASGMNDRNATDTGNRKIPEAADDASGVEEDDSAGLPAEPEDVDLAGDESDENPAVNEVP